MNKILQNLGSSLTGNISKAVLCIRDPRVYNKEEDGLMIMDKAKVDSDNAIDDVSNLNKELLKLTSDGGGQGGILNAAKKALTQSVAGYKTIKEKANEKSYIALELQYNPSSIRIDTMAGSQYDYSGEGGNQQLRVYESPVSTTLNCELLFDDCNNMDAFMLNDNPVTGLTVSNLANSITSAVKGKYTVQRQMEGILSMLTVDPAKNVIFFWGNMCFRGQLTQVNTAYTMFNKKGFPVRGKMGIAIRQGSSVNKGEEALNYDDSYWDHAFDATFTEKGNQQSTWRKATNNALLNLNL
ncbi:MAG: hypothetical protein K6G03_11090 [Lachnospiraceae bacterium]|nr:hypothetical protein [Lachnospiraceae bacterium]